MVDAKTKLRRDRLQDREIPVAMVLENLVQVLQWLGADAATQVRVYTKQRSRRRRAALEVPDELALMFDDSYVVVPHLVEAGLVDARQRAMLDQIDALYAEMSEEPLRQAVWTLAAVQTDPHWKEVRDLAGGALQLFGRQQTHPTMFDRGWRDRMSTVALLVLLAVLLLMCCAFVGRHLSGR